MNVYEKTLLTYSTIKLKEIVEKQSNAYNIESINLAKDELIKRGEKVVYSKEEEEEISKMENDDLKQIVEHDFNNYNLFYLELARNEYLKRNFINNTTPNEEEKYSFLKKIIIVYYIVAIIIGLSTLFSVYKMLQMSGTVDFFMIIIVGIIAIIGIIGIAELTKVIMDIEKNTRN